MNARACAPRVLRANSVLRANRVLRVSKVLYIAVAGSAIAFAVGAVWIPVKAQLAQILLQRAWAETRRGEAQAKPWPWADTWPVARLRVDQHGVDLIVLAGTSGHALAFGPGHLSASARPGEEGHSIVSGHRDTHFRFLEHILPGDMLSVEKVDGHVRRYRVTARSIVYEEAFDVPEESDDALTLVTCYPFDAILPGGPLRYVVRAEPVIDREPKERGRAA